MGHISPTVLTKLGQNTITVRLRGPSIAKCSSCVIAKIIRQISYRPNPNKATRPFYRIHLNWFNLEEDWDGYQYDRRLVYRCLLIICEATGMTLAYFTTCAKENENLPIIRDVINWLHLRYNVAVQIVWSDREMNQNWTKV